jgi:hypothetical protein
MEALPLCLLLNKLRLFSRTKNSYIFIQIVTLHVTYTFWSVRRPSSGMYVKTKVV